MNYSSKIKIALLLVASFILAWFFESGEKKEHPIENEFPQDTSLRIYLTSAASITASPTTNSESVGILKNFINS